MERQTQQSEAGARRFEVSREGWEPRVEAAREGREPRPSLRLELLEARLAPGFAWGT
jgi:hypothetical protein